MNTASCGDRIEIPNGETVTPCDLPEGHDGDHLGWCLGSRARWANEKLGALQNFVKRYGANQIEEDM